MRSSGEFSMLNGINALAEKLFLTKKSIFLSFSLLTCQIGIDINGIHTKYRKDIFCDECEKLTAESDGRSTVER